MHRGRNWWVKYRFVLKMSWNVLLFWKDISVLQERTYVVLFTTPWALLERNMNPEAPGNDGDSTDEHDGETGTFWFGLCWQNIFVWSQAEMSLYCVFFFLPKGDDQRKIQPPDSKKFERELAKLQSLIREKEATLVSIEMFSLVGFDCAASSSCTRPSNLIWFLDFLSVTELVALLAHTIYIFLDNI